MHDTHRYIKHFTDQGFWEKIKFIAIKVGRPLIERALLLYYTAQNPHSPLWARRTIYGALGYLILPFDLIPDVLFPLGYSDDLAILVAALAAVSSYTNATAHAYTAEKIKEWFN